MGILVTAARPTGIAVLIGLVAVMISRRPSRARDYGVLLAVLGIGGWCAYLAFRFGHPFAFVETEGWHAARDHGPGVATWLKFDFFHAVLHDPWRGWVRLRDPSGDVRGVPRRRAGCAPPVRQRLRRVRRGRRADPAMSTDDFMGTGRYVLAAFPIFALIGSRLAHRPVGRWAYVTVSTTAMVFGATLFATGYILS